MMRSNATVLRVVYGLAVALVSAMVYSASALAASSGPAWEISSVAQPSNFSVEDNSKCHGHEICDRYVVTLTNVGNGPVNGGSPNAPVVIADTLPKGLRLVEMKGENLENEAVMGCPTTTTCTYEGIVRPGGTLVLFLQVEVEERSGPGVMANAVSVTGGGASPASTSEPLTLPNTVDGPLSEFGFAAFGFAAHDPSGALDTQAADHPVGVTTTVNLSTIVKAQSIANTYRFASVEPLKDLVVYLPVGFVGDPTAARQCTQVQLLGNGTGTETECPAASRVGNVVLFEEGSVLGSVANEVTSVYNMVPEPGYPAEFALKVLDKAVPIYANVVHTDSGYALRVGTPGIPTTIATDGLALTFFGDPSAADGVPNSSQAFLTNPADCKGGPLEVRAEADSWAEPGRWASAEPPSIAYPEVTGCDLLRFEPTLELSPEVTRAEEPSGYEIKIKVPQTPNQFPALATPDLMNVTMTLPTGMTVAPGGADGLTGCEATGPHGIDMPSGEHHPSEAGEGEAIGPDGMSHLVSGHCPQSSQIGAVKIATPVLASPLEGHLYVAQPQCGGRGQPECTAADATDGHLFGLYLEAAGSGVVVKLAGSVSANPATGQLTAKFLENPQLPFSELALNIEGGGRAPLSNPRQCGVASASGDLAPWSAPITPDATVSSLPFVVDWDGVGGACPATLPFAPGVVTGVTNVAAGHFSPFTLTVTRGDREQDLARLQVKMPAGLLGMLSKVSLCGEPQAARGACGEASQIGTTSVEAGSGPQPLGVKGRVYLTGPYGGSPFGLSIVVPAVAGPFNLGNVVVRARIDVDPSTSAITVTSDPLPQILDGVPLRIQTLNVAVEREGFIFNPTSCAAKQIATTIEAVQGASARTNVPFAVEGCRDLPFSPKFSVSTQAQTSKKSGASLDVKVASGPGQANIGKVVVSLPKQLPARLTTLQKACPEATFAQNPATCPVSSDVGTAKAVTPVLGEPLVGPAYLVSHGGAAFPDLVVILEAQGVRLDLVGNTSIKKNITTSTFDSVPDAPVSTFELKLPEGSHSVLTSNLSAKANGSLCGVKLVMPTTIIGQNGVQVKQSTKIAVSGCRKVHITRRTSRRRIKKG
jgi:uncharacterized repeat protein (TIGR01451 family)